MSDSQHICADCPDNLEDCYPDVTGQCSLKIKNYPHLIPLKVHEVKIIKLDLKEHANDEDQVSSR
jgi:hypothetical protein